MRVTVKLDNEPIDFDMDRVTVTVTSPIVCLKRLTNAEISRYVDGSQISLKRKSDVSTQMMTRAKKQKISTVLQNVNASNVEPHKQTSNEMIHDSNKHHTNETKSNKEKTSDPVPSYALRTMVSKRPSQRTSTHIQTNLENRQHSSIERRKCGILNEETDGASTFAKDRTVALPDFSVDDIVWAKLRGSPHWPARIVAIENGRFEIYWYNDYRKSKVNRSQLFKFHVNFDTFSKKGNSNVHLETAIKEALITLASKAKN